MLQIVVSPCSCGMIVYRLVTSIDTRIAFSMTSIFFRKLRKSRLKITRFVAWVQAEAHYLQMMIYVP